MGAEQIQHIWNGWSCECSVHYLLTCLPGICNNVREEIPWFFICFFPRRKWTCQPVQQVTVPHKFPVPDSDDNAAASHAAVGGQGQGSPLSCEPWPRHSLSHIVFLHAAPKILWPARSHHSSMRVTNKRTKACIKIKATVHGDGKVSAVHAPFVHSISSSIRMHVYRPTVHRKTAVVLQPSSPCPTTVSSHGKRPVPFAGLFL